MHKKGFRAYSYWVLICAILWVAAWIIAEAIPVFSDLLGITGALFASWFTFGLSGMFWLKLNFTREGRAMNVKGVWSWKKGALFVVNIASIVVATAIVSATVLSHCASQLLTEAFCTVCYWTLCFGQEYCIQHEPEQAVFLP